jgi:hypothetical protein
VVRMDFGQQFGKNSLNTIEAEETIRYRPLEISKFGRTGRVSRSSKGI